MLFEDNSGHEEKRDGFIFLKKYQSENGRPNTIVMIINKGGVTIGPHSAHPKAITVSWLANKKLVITKDGEFYNADKGDSAFQVPLLKDNAESNSSNIATTVPNSGADVKRNSVTTSISDVAAHDPSAIGLSGMRDSITTEASVADKIRAWADTPEAWDRYGIQLVLRQTRIV